MPKYLKEGKESGIVSEAIEKAEDILRVAGIHLNVYGPLFMTTDCGDTFRLVDTESGEDAFNFPRIFDEERFRLCEDGEED